MSSIDLDHDGTTQDPETPLLRDNKTVAKKKQQKRIFTAIALVVIAVAVAMIVCYELGVFDSATADSAVYYEMNLFTILNETIKCNDGTTPGYYLRYSPTNNTNWVIQFPGGNCCYDNSSCGDRFLGHSHAADMTAPTDPIYWGEGVTSSDPAINPHLWDWNSVEVHYCTSDYWLGTNAIGPDQEWFLPNFYFHGGLLLPYMFTELQALHGLSHASTILFSGYSVAGLGILQLWDRVKDQLHTIAPQAELFALSDSGWWLWNSTYQDYDTSPTNKVWPLSMVNTKPLLHPDCLAVEVEQPEKCFAGDVVYQYINNKDTLLVSQQMFDKIHLNSEGFSITLDYKSPNLTWHLGAAQRYYDTMQQVVNAFASDCRDHDLIDSSTMDIIAIMDRSDPLGTNYSLVESIERLRRGEYIHFFDECGTPDCNPTCPIIDAKEAGANANGDFDPNNMLG